MQGGMVGLAIKTMGGSVATSKKLPYGDGTDRGFIFRLSFF